MLKFSPTDFLLKLLQAKENFTKENMDIFGALLKAMCPFCHLRQCCKMLKRNLKLLIPFQSVKSAAFLS